MPAHVQWEIEADYLAQLCAQLVLTVSPQRIIMGGGVMARTSFPAVRRRTLHWLGGYIDRREILSRYRALCRAAGARCARRRAGALCLAAATLRGQRLVLPSDSAACV